jgi:hypothetical protein
MVINNSKSDAVILVKFRNPLPSSMLRFPSKLGPPMLFKQGLYPPSSFTFLSSCFTVHYNKLCAAINYIFIRTGRSGQNLELQQTKCFWEEVSVWTSSVCQYCSQCSGTLFNQFCSRTLFAFACTRLNKAVFLIARWPLFPLTPHHIATIMIWSVIFSIFTKIALNVTIIDAT